MWVDQVQGYEMFWQDWIVAVLSMNDKGDVGRSATFTRSKEAHARLIEVYYSFKSWRKSFKSFATWPPTLAVQTWIRLRHQRLRHDVEVTILAHGRVDKTVHLTANWPNLRSSTRSFLGSCLLTLDLKSTKLQVGIDSLVFTCQKRYKMSLTDGCFVVEIGVREMNEMIKRAPSMDLQTATILIQNSSNLTIDKVGLVDENR